MSRLSFYKEELAGEQNNYVHLRAAVEQLSPLEVLTNLTEEVLDTAKRVGQIIGGDLELRMLWEQYCQVCAGIGAGDFGAHLNHW